MAFGFNSNCKLLDGTRGTSSYIVSVSDHGVNEAIVLSAAYISKDNNLST